MGVMLKIIFLENRIQDRFCGVYGTSHCGGLWMREVLLGGSVWGWDGGNAVGWWLVGEEAQSWEATGIYISSVAGEEGGVLPVCLWNGKMFSWNWTSLLLNTWWVSRSYRRKAFWPEGYPRNIHRLAFEENLSRGQLILMHSTDIQPLWDETSQGSVWRELQKGKSN